MKKQLQIISMSLFFFLLVSSSFAERKPGDKISKSFGVTSLINPTSSLLNINNMAIWVRDDGETASTPSGSSGLYYPRGTGTAVYLDGIIWGGVVQDTRNPGLPQLRVGGQTYRIGTTPGWIVTPGDVSSDPVAIDPNDSRARVYRIRKDWQSLTTYDTEIIQDAAELNEIEPYQVTQQMAQAILDQYETDWNEWPTDFGAPYYDNNDNGSYDGGDEPGLANADQVIWFVCNDLDSTRSLSLAGSPPTGIELQVTMWGYNQPTSSIGQSVFRRYRFINKSGFEIDSMYVSQWSDPDLGSAGDDVVGCDTTLSLGYVYNGYSSDSGYNLFGLVPPAVGYYFIQGPIVESPGDSAFFNFQTIYNYKNLPMSSFGYIAAGDPLIFDPRLGSYEGTLEWYNWLRGFTPTQDLVNPTPYHVGNNPSNPTTKFPLAGDPVTGVGDVDGSYDMNLSPTDRRIVLCSGPFSMDAGDVQEIVVATVGGIGGTYLESVTDLKQNASIIKSFYQDVLIDTAIIDNENDTAEISLSDTLIDFGNVYIGSKKVKTLIITNDGIADLIISNISVESNEFQINTSGLTIGSNEQDSVLITFIPESIGAIESFLNLTTNDPNKPTILIDLRGVSLALGEPALVQNYPNPFRPSSGGVTIKIEPPQDAVVIFEVFNILGQKVYATKQSIASGPNSSQFDWNGRTNSGKELPSGIYFYSLDIGSELLKNKLVILK